MQFLEMGGDLLFQIPAYAMTGAAVAREDVGIRVPWNMTVTAADWTPQAAVTANGTNFATLSLRNRGAAGAGTALPVSRSYAATNSVAFVPEAMTLSGTATDLTLSAGDVLTVQMLFSGTGLVIPSGTVRLVARIR
jgi:hypothetical protein